MKSKNWIEKPDGLYKSFVFKSFLEAMNFMQISAHEIEKMNHHPEWSNVYNRVEVCLRTHDAGNKVTNKDKELSEILDRVAGQIHEFH